MQEGVFYMEAFGPDRLAPGAGPEDKKADETAYWFRPPPKSNHPVTANDRGRSIDPTENSLFREL